VRDGFGRVTRLVGVSTDIESRKFVETQRELEVTQERDRRVAAEAEVELRDRVMAILSHDLRQPLAVIDASATLLGRSSLAQKRDLAAIDYISRNTRRAIRLVRDLLEYSRVGAAGAMPVAPRRVDLGAVCQRAVDDAKAEMPGRELMLQMENPLAGSWDAERLQQMLANLIGNALKHGRDDRPVRVTASSQGEMAIIEVHNEGTPIPAALHGAIFEPFHRLLQPGERSGSGLGLGLFIVKEIARAHGGTVSLRSTEPEGTTFQVRLPLPLAAKARPTAALDERASGSAAA
jgi:signal transduction histidine kinase